jgi:hypothetical protein
MLRLVLMQESNMRHLEPVQLITKINKNILTAENLVRVVVNIPPATREAVLYILSNNVKRRVILKP